MAPSTAQDLYDLLMADAALVAALGRYAVLGEASTRPAVAVLRDGEALPSGTEVSGVELVIRRSSDYDPQLLYDGQLLRPPFRLYAVQWQVATGAAYQLDAVVRRVLALLPGAKATSNTVPTGYGDGGIDQTVITWTNPTVSL